MDIQSVLRLMSMFGGPQQLTQNNSAQVLNPMPDATPFTGAGMPNAQVSQPPSDLYDPMARMKQLYQPRTTLSQKYTDALGQMPQDQPVGRARGLAAIASSALVGAHNPQLGYEIGHNVAQGPNERAMADWQNQTKMLGLGAGEEDRYNTNQRLLANETVSREEQNRKLSETERADKTKEGQTQQKIDISNARAQAYIFKSTHPQWKAAPTKGGNLILYNPQNPTETIDTKLPLGTLDDYDKIQFGLDAKLQEIGATGQNQSSNIAQRGNIQFGLVGARGDQARQTKSTPSGAGAQDTSQDVTVKDNKGNIVGTRHTETNKTPQSVLRNKAIAYINALPPGKNGKLQPTEANIKHAIDSGLVK